MKQFKITTIILLVDIALIQGCKSKHVDQDNCFQSYKESQSALNMFYETNDTIYLKTALRIADQNCFSCPTFKLKFVDMKITIFILLKNYKKGIEFIDSLNVQDFENTYKINFYLKTLNALYLDSHEQYIKRDSVLKILYSDLEHYISRNPKDKNDALYDLYLTKAKFENRDHVLKEIDSLNIKMPTSVNFLNVLKETIKSLP